MAEEADPRGAARGALSIAAIILCVITIGVVTAFFITRVKPENNCEPIANTQPETESTIDITEARHMFEDFVFYGGQNAELLIRQLFPDETVAYDMEISELRTKINYEDFINAYDNYLSKNLQTIYEREQSESGAGYFNCDGKFCVDIKAIGEPRYNYYRGVIEDFWQSSDNSFEATVHSVLMNENEELVFTQTEHYVMEFAPNGNGGFKFTKLEID